MFCISKNSREERDNLFYPVDGVFVTVFFRYPYRKGWLHPDKLCIFVV